MVLNTRPASSAVAGRDGGRRRRLKSIDWNSNVRNILPVNGGC